MNGIVGVLREAYCRREPKEGARVVDVHASDAWADGTGSTRLTVKTVLTQIMTKLSGKYVK
jgi:hypothetical protein